MAVKAARRPSVAKPVLVLNGPNLNMLGKRQPEIYGRETLADVEKACRAEAVRLGLSVEFSQSNHEGVLVDRIQAARERNSGIVIESAPPGSFLRPVETSSWPRTKSNWKISGAFCFSHSSSMVSACSCSAVYL